MKLLERERSKRFQSAREALAALPDAALGRAELVALLRELRPVGALDDSVSPSATSARPRRRRGAAVLVASLALAGAAALGLSLWHFAEQPRVHVPAVPRAAEALVPVMHDQAPVRNTTADGASELKIEPTPAPLPRSVPSSSEETEAPRPPVSHAVQHRKRPSPRAMHLVPDAKIVPAPVGSGHLLPDAEFPGAVPRGPEQTQTHDTHKIWEEIVPDDPDQPSPIWEEIDRRSER